MRTTVKFQMDEPTNAKWDCYVKLLPEIDDIIRNLDVDLLTRKTQESDHTVEEVFDHRNQAQFLELTKGIVTLVTKCDLTFTLLKSVEEPRAEGYKTTMNVRLRTGYRSRKYWEKWQEKAKADKEAMMFHGVHMRRDLDIANYAVRTTAYYRRPADFANAFFIAGWMYGRANIPLETSDVFEERYQLDLLEDMKEITKKIRRTI